MRCVLNKNGNVTIKNGFFCTKNDPFTLKHMDLARTNELCFKCFAYAHTSFTYACYSRRPYADKFEHVTTVSAYAQQLLRARIEVVIGKIKQWTMKTWKKREKMMKKYHQQKLAEHEADDVFFDSTLAESTGITGEFLFGRHGQLLAKHLWLTRSLRDRSLQGSQY